MPFILGSPRSGKNGAVGGFMEGGGPPGCFGLEGCTICMADGELMEPFTIKIHYTHDEAELDACTVITSLTMTLTLIGGRRTDVLTLRGVRGSNSVAETSTGNVCFKDG